VAVSMLRLVIFSCVLMSVWVLTFVYGVVLLWSTPPAFIICASNLMHYITQL